MYKVLITDHIAAEGIEFLEKDPNISYDVIPGISNDEIKKILHDYDAIITRSGTNVDADLLENIGKLKIIARAGVGLDNVDIETASKKGLIVMNAPTGNTLAAAELTMGMIMAAARKIPAASESTKKGEWDRKRFMGVQLYNKNLGIVGIGRIGGNVIQRCKAFGMKVYAFDPYVKESRAEKLGVTLCKTLDEVLAVADVLTFHTPLTDETRNLISDKEINKMKDGAILVNCARGGIVSEDAIYNGVKSGKLFAAAVDVFDQEPPTGSKLLELENIFLTPHIGANTDEGQKGVAVIICEQVAHALNGRQYQNAVNIPYMKSQLPADMKIYFELAVSMGRLAAQMLDVSPEELVLSMIGKRFEEDFGERTFDSPYNYQPFTVAALKGFLEVSLNDNITFVSAPYSAKDHNITVMEQKLEHYQQYNDLLVLKARSKDKELTITGAVYPDQRAYITSIDGFNLDLLASGNYLYFRNNDTPGIIGKIGTHLGNNGINIANFELSRVHKDDFAHEAVAFVLVDGHINTDVIESISKVEGILAVRQIKL